MRFPPWVRITRPFAFPASLIPVFIGGALALYQDKPALWAIYPLVIICALLLHAGTNVVSEYYDFKKGLDQKHAQGADRILVIGAMAPRAALLEGHLLLVAAFLLGMFLVFLRGLPMLIIGTTGLLGGYFYSAGPIGYKYRGLGDFLVFALMGPLMVTGAYFALTGSYDHRVLSVSLPIGFLAAAILSSNNLRDILNDKEVGVKTLAGTIGYQAAKWEYFLLLGLAYFSIAVMTAVNILPIWSLITLATLPLALKNTALVKKSGLADLKKLTFIDVMTAKLHLAFGLCLALSLLL